MAIHVIQSQRIDVLVQGLLQNTIRPSKNPFAVLQTQHFIVPSPAVQEWLSQRIAEQQGISANSQFHQRIRGFQWFAYQQVLDDKDKVRKANIPRLIMKWRIYQTLKSFIEQDENSLAQDHPLHGIIQRIYDAASQLEQGLEKQLKKQSMLYWVSEQVSKLFSHYMLYRGDCQRGCQQNNGQACRELTEAQVLTKAAQESDPLFSKVLKMFASRIAYACERLKLVIDQLDELFVGTLDSFSQKLLREFAFESGKIERAEITDDAKSYSQQLIHDVLRAWIQKQPQDIVDSLMFAGELHGVDYYVATVEQSLNFASANFIEPKFSNADVQLFQQAIEQLAKIQLDQLQTLQSYYLLDGEFYKFANGTKFRNDRLNRIFAKSLPRIIQTLQQHDYKHYLSSKLSVEKSDFATLMKVIREQQIFKKAAPENVQSDFYQHTLIQQLLSIYAQIEIYENQLLGTNTFLKYYLAKEVKTRLPQVLQQKGETTFAQQIRTLAEALQGEQGQRFATFVHARYPLILVDEFQDTNQDQDDMLAQIWRHPNRVKQGCMIMVGDRKQAIYGFRGGDMLTFLKAHQDVFGKAGHEFERFAHRASCYFLR